MRHSLGLAMIAAALGLVPGAQAQLTPADIAALRERGQREGWTFAVGESEGTRRPHEQLCGLQLRPDWWVGARFDPCIPTRDLPAYFNWCDLGGCTPVKDQAGCGSCWAFATVGPLECNILYHDGVTTDLSEQWLLSCNTDGFTCGGGDFAHDYHLAKGDACGDVGAVYESAFPYVAEDVPCGCPYTHSYLIDEWAYVGDAGSIPPVEAIKQAMLDHGPVAVGVRTPPAFMAYDGGVFNACDPPGELDHAVTLVGWDDSQGASGVWFLRNSWGPGWGEGGYMRIEYGCVSVGYAANYVVYPGTAWVDFAYNGAEEGSFTKPYNTVAEGADAVTSGGHLRIKAGATAETVTITKAMTVHAYAGSVTIGQ